MTLTTTGNLVIPEVWAAAVQAKVRGNLVFANFAVTYNDLQGSPGETLNLVEFQRLTELSADQDEATALTPELLTSNADQAILIREGSKAVELSWRARNGAFGNPVEYAEVETARVISRRVNAVMRDAAYAAATLEDKSSAIIDADAVTAGLLHYGDAIVQGKDSGIALLVHSKVFHDLKKVATFERDENRQLPGFVGILDSTVAVFVSDLITVMEDAGGAGVDHYKNLLFHAQPLAYAHKKELETHQADDILKRSTTISSTLYYAAGVMRPEQIVELRTL